MYLDRELKAAKWITAPTEFASPVISRSFSVQNPQAGQIAVSALGFFTLFVNGRRVGEDYFLPSNSLFRKRNLESLLYPISDKFTCRCYYSTYDLTSYLREGENTLEIALGDGWYRQLERVAEGAMTFGDALGAVYALSLTDDSGERILHSDGNEACRSTARIESQLFIGETYDARIDKEKEYTYDGVSVLVLPETLLTPEDTVPDRVIRRLKPVLLSDNGSRRIYDTGENISGFVTLSTRAKWGERVRMRFAEVLKDGELDFESAGCHYICSSGRPQIMEDVFIGDGEEHLFEPMFVWHAFRYFEVIGDGEPVSVAVLHSDTPVTSSFDSDSKELNWLFEAFLRTQLNNMHGGVPSDCPHRERLGYTGDGQVCAPAAMTMLDCKAFYRKWIRDIFDSQDTVGGHINHTAPFSGGGGGPGGWGCAAVIVPYHYYRYFGDTKPLTEHYDGMKKWISYLTSRLEDGLVVREEEGGWCLGEWITLEKTVIPEPLVNTCYYVKSLRCLEEISDAIGEDRDIPGFQKLRTEAEMALIRHYYSEETGSFDGGIQGADAFVIFAGLGDRRTFRNLADKYRSLGHFDTGFLGTDILCGLLFEGGEEDLVVDLLTSHDLGSFGYMMDRGATTIWEDWRGHSSHDHPMFGACARYLLSHILGIRQKEGSAAFEKTVIAPCIPKKLHWAAGSMTLPAGEVSVKWERTSESIRFTIVLPEKFFCDFEYRGSTRKLYPGKNIFTERG